MSEHAVEQEGVTEVEEDAAKSFILQAATKEDTIQYAAKRLEELPPDLRLLRKLDGWLRAQPEWPVFLYGTREQRKRIAKAIAKAIVTIPHR